MSSLGRAISSGSNVLEGWRRADADLAKQRQNTLLLQDQNRQRQMLDQFAREGSGSFAPIDTPPPAGLTLPTTDDIGFEQIPEAQAPVAPAATKTPTNQVAQVKTQLDSMGVDPAATKIVTDAAKQNRKLTPQELDRIALLKFPTALIDVLQTPVAAGLNVASQLITGFANLSGRAVNAITGEPTVKTDYTARSWGATPLYDEYVRAPLEGDAAAREAETKKPPVDFSGITAAAKARNAQKAPVNFSNIAAAVEQVESRGRADAVSPKGAVGPMQTMPGTLADPGFGVRPAQSNTPEEQRRVGQDYLQAMLTKYNGNLDHALAAYNWGPSNTDAWIAAGADKSKLPKETRDYIPKVKTAMGVKGQESVTVDMGQEAAAEPLKMPQSQRENISMAESYLADPQAIPFEMERLNTIAQEQISILTQQRNEIARYAQILMQSGTADGVRQAMEMRNLIAQKDGELSSAREQVVQKQMYLQGMQGLREFAQARDPRRLSAVLSRFLGVPTAIQPRSDGTFNYFVNGVKTQSGVSAQQIASAALREFSPEARTAASELAALETKLQIELRYAPQVAAAIATATGKIETARTTGEYNIAVQDLKRLGFDVKVDTASGVAYVVKDGRQVYVLKPAVDLTTPQGIIPGQPTASRVSGL